MVSEEIDEYARVQHEINLDINNPLNKSLWFIIAPTMRCQCKCFYCYEQRNTLSTEEMSANTCDNVINFILNSVQKHTETLDIGWFGGEPLLGLQSILKIGNGLQNKLKEGVTFSSRIVTNGVYLTKDICLELVEKCNLTHAQITLDGLEKQHCAAKKCKKEDFWQVLKNIKECASIIKISVCYNLSRNNYSDLEPLMRLLLVDNGLLNKIDIHLVRVKPYCKDCDVESKCFTGTEYDEIKSKFDDFLKNIGQVSESRTVKRASPCSLLKNGGGAIDPSGYLYKCEHYLGQKEKATGDVVNGWYFNRQYIDSQKAPFNDKCSDCQFYPRCGFALCPELRTMGMHKNGTCTYIKVIENRIKNSIDIMKGE